MDFKNLRRKQAHLKINIYCFIFMKLMLKFGNIVVGGTPFKAASVYTNKSRKTQFSPGLSFVITQHFDELGKE